MADYIYLLQNRLTQAQRRALEAIRDAARAHTMPVFLVGGAARDLTSGTPVRDLDFALQGDAGMLASELEAGGALVTGENPVFGSKYLRFPGGVRAELAPTVTVSYPKPGEAVTQPATILDDLRRRDFTANAMAISLNEGSYGLLLDPLNGVADIENRELRLVSNYGFIEQPALALRIARLSERLGWTMEERTAARYSTAKEENYIAALPERDRGYELEEIFYEEDPLATLEHLTAEGWARVLSPTWVPAKADREALDRVRDLMGQLEQMGISIDPAPVYFPLLTAKLNAEELDELKRTFVRGGFTAQIESLDARSKELGSQITAKHAAAPSETWKLLFAAEPETVLWLAYSSRSGAIQAKFKAFLNEWPQMRQRVPYALMQEMRITPDLPEYEKLLEDLFFALLDGKLDTTEATRAFLEPYSPPAPVVAVSPRRRPAKAARSRSRKAAVEVAASEADGAEDAVETTLPEGAGTAAHEDEVPSASSEVKAGARKAASPKVSTGKKIALVSTASTADETSLTSAELPVASKTKASVPANAAEKKPEVERPTPAAPKVPAKDAAIKKVSPGSDSPAKSVARAVPTVAAKVASKKVAGKQVAVKTAASPSPAKGTAVAKKAAPAKAAKKAAASSLTRKPAAKQVVVQEPSAKKATAKPMSKGGVKAAASKLPAKKPANKTKASPAAPKTFAGSKKATAKTVKTAAKKRR